MDPEAPTESGGFPEKKYVKFSQKASSYARFPGKEVRWVGHGIRPSEGAKWGLVKRAYLFIEATNFGSEKFAAIGVKFCTKYVKISQKFHS